MGRLQTGPYRADQSLSLLQQASSRLARSVGRRAIPGGMAGPPLLALVDIERAAQVAIRPLDLWLVRRVLEPSPVALVTSIFRGRPNVMTAAWLTVIGSDPPRLALAVRPDTLTHEFVSRSESFGLSIPPLDLLSAVQRCGTVSGRDEDKFVAAGLTERDPSEIEAPLIERCGAFIECGLIDRLRLSDHDLFVGEVLGLAAEEQLFSDRWLIHEGSELIHHIAGAEYTGLGKVYTARLEPEEGEE